MRASTTRFERSADEPPEGTPGEAEVDDTLAGSFPASDPPFWTLGLTDEASALPEDADAGDPPAGDPSASES